MEAETGAYVEDFAEPVASFEGDVFDANEGGTWIVGEFFDDVSNGVVREDNVVLSKEDEFCVAVF